MNVERNVLANVEAVLKLIRSSLSICSFNKTVMGMYTTHKHY